jgi:hypothetical protein
MQVLPQRLALGERGMLDLVRLHFIEHHAAGLLDERRHTGLELQADEHRQKAPLAETRKHTRLEQRGLAEP